MLLIFAIAAGAVLVAARIARDVAADHQAPGPVLRSSTLS
jgi:hypothetical protein